MVRHHSLPFDSHLFSARLPCDIWRRAQLRLAGRTTILNGETPVFCGGLHDTRMAVHSDTRYSTAIYPLLISPFDFSSWSKCGRR
jgi:hypothetical protein